jgi:hypothetical protein
MSTAADAMVTTSQKMHQNDTIDSFSLYSLANTLNWIFYVLITWNVSIRYCDRYGFIAPCEFDDIKSDSI